MTHIKQITAALSDLIERPFEPVRGQNTRLRDGYTTEAVIASLPGQIADRQGDIAQQISQQTGRKVTADVIKPWMVAHLLRLDVPIKGFSNRNVWQELYPDGLIQIGMSVQDDVDPVTWAFRRFLGRDPQPVGMNHYTAQLAKGRPVWEVIREIELSDEALAKVS